MGQLGSTLKRLVVFMTDNYNLKSPFLFYKINILDGFWRILVVEFLFCPPCIRWLTSLPRRDRTRVANSITNRMVQIITFLCAGSETARDFISDLVKGNKTLPWQKFELIMIQIYLHPTMPGKPIDTIEVFVDYFVDATNNYDLTHLLHILRCMLRVIHAIYRPLRSLNMKEVIKYPKKLNKGDGTWAQEK